MTCPGIMIPTRWHLLSATEVQALFDTYYTVYFIWHFEFILLKLASQLTYSPRKRTLSMTRLSFSSLVLCFALDRRLDCTLIWRDVRRGIK